MDFESPDVEKDFPGLYASETGRKSNESDFSDGDHEKPSKKDLLIGRRKDKKDSKKDRGYAALAGESSPDEDTETKSPSKSKKTKSFKFPSKSKEKREKSRDKEKVVEKEVKDTHHDKEKKKEKEKDKKEKDKKSKDKEKEKEEKVKTKESKEKIKEKDKDKVKEKDKEKLKEKDKDKKEKKVQKIQPTVTSGVPFEEIFTLEVALPIFGVPLSVSIQRSRCHDDTGLPLVVRDCIDYLQEHGLKSTSLYRADVDRVKVQQLRRLYGERATFCPYHWDIPTACALLLSFLSELPEPIVTNELWQQFEDVASSPNSDVQKEAALQTLLSQMPAAHRALLGWLVTHFHSVLAHEQVNHVTLQILTALMAPTLNISAALLKLFINNSQRLFPDVTLTKYIPPLAALPSEFPNGIEEMARELRKQESLLSQIHAEMHAGFVTPLREEQLWEGQRIVTQLKRKLRSVQKSAEPSTSYSTQASVDEKQSLEDDIPQVKTPNTESAKPTHTVVHSTDIETYSIKTASTSSTSTIDAFQTEVAKETHVSKGEDSVTGDSFEDNFNSSTPRNPITKMKSLETSNVTTPENNEKDSKPKLTEHEMKLLKLQLENAEFLQLKSTMQAKINSERFEIVKLRSHMAIKSKQENNCWGRESGVITYTMQADAELRQKLVKENALLEQKRLNLINQIFQERVACVQLKIQLAMNEIL